MVKKMYKRPELVQLSVSKTAAKPNPGKGAGSFEGHVHGNKYSYPGS